MPPDQPAAMWCDTFDADLLAVVPGAAEALGPAAEVRLLTYSRLTNGRINHPSCWSTDEGFAAFFWTGARYRPPAGYVTDAPVADARSSKLSGTSGCTPAWSSSTVMWCGAPRAG